MVDYSEYDDSWFTNKSTYIRLNWNACGEELSERDDVRYLLSDQALVQAEDWPARFNANLAHFTLAGGMRKTNDACLPGLQFLQFTCDCILRSSYLWDGGDVDL